MLIQVFENCVKGYIQQGKAYLGLKKYEEALVSYKKIIEIEPEKSKQIQGKSIDN